MSKMNATEGTDTGGSAMRRSLSLPGAWALSLGCAVGWGAFMMPGNTFLPVAGPLGTVIGILTGALIMLIVGVNYSRVVDVSVRNLGLVLEGKPPIHIVDRALGY